MTQTSNRLPLAPSLEELLSVDLFRALSDPNRLAMLSWLCGEGCACSVGDVARSNCCDVSLSVVSRHLKALREAGVLEARKSGKEVLYTVRTGELIDHLRAIADALEACCGPEGTCVVTAPPTPDPGGTP